MNEKQIEDKTFMEELLVKASQGEPEVQNQLGLCYQYGRGINKDYDEAEKYFQLAANQGHREAKNNLALL
jgi:TPR repeat protein